LAAVCSAAVLVACAGCSAVGAGRSASTAVRPAAGSGTASAGSSSGQLKPPTVAGLAWHPEGTVVRGQRATYVAVTGQGSVALMWMNPAVLTFRFIPGFKYPEHGPIRPADRLPSTWTPRMAAAFNGAFKLLDNVGGYYYAGVTVKPLQAGLASLVVDARGHLSVVRWGRERSSVVGVALVRQNMSLLVDQYTARTSVHDTNSTWGWADHDTRLANRSALGQLTDGSLVYVYGHDVTAQDMAAALVGVHARTGIMLDMNLSQPGGFVYWRQAGQVRGQRILPSIYHPPTVYLHPDAKDFLVAMTRP
jgi:hypothetical protein